MAKKKADVDAEVDQTKEADAVERLTGEERVDALCTFLQKHGIHVPEEIAAQA